MKNNKKKQHYRSLERKIRNTIILMSFIPMFLISGMILYQFYTAYHKKICEHLGELILKHKQSIDFFLTEKLADIHFLANTSTIIDLSDESYLQSRLAEFQKGYGNVFVDIGVIDNNGEQIAYAGPFKLGKASYKSAEWFQSAIKNDYVISDVFLGLRGLPHFIVAVKKVMGSKSWIIRATIDFVKFNTLVNNIHIGKTDFAFILNKKGAFQTKSLADIIPVEERQMSFYRNNFDTSSKDKIKIIHKNNKAGKKNIYVTAFLKNGDWMLVYEQQTPDAMYALHNALKLAVLIMFLCAVIVIVMTYRISNKILQIIKQADNEKQQMNIKVVETGKMASVGQLASGVAHEINNPVAIMMEEAGWIMDLLEEEDLAKSNNKEEFIRALQQIRTQGNRCKQITHKLLSFARKSDAVVEDVQINSLIEEVVSLSAQRAKYSKVKIDLNLMKYLPLLKLSPSEMQQVLLNLINNALDAMDQNGGILYISSKINKNLIEINIKDNGQGIPESNIDRIFDPFFTTKPVGKGTGLGLSICYGIIKKMGGEIEVQSVVDKGTCFKIKFPFNKS
ncbi:integral membrane sensor signal transduction histidine kinase [Candidatus Magnetomorum sp. HK-1]|nr:integral membrane sensor signal transduction histidine kinase [Candidatus Magnetomorum sp. HK-1]